MGELEYSLIAQRLLLSGKYPAAVGGLCERGTEEKCIGLLKEIESFELVPTADGVVLDAQLFRVLQESAPKEFRYAAMTVAVPWPVQPCGGIAGGLWEDVESAPGTLCRLDNRIWGFALPGACASIMLAEKATAAEIYDQAQKLYWPLQRDDIETLLTYMQTLEGEFLFVSDGCGGSCGCLSTIVHGKRNSLWV